MSRKPALAARSVSLSRAPLLIVALLAAAACGGSGGSPSGLGGGNSGDAELVRIQYGRLVDVYGLRRGPEGVVVEPYDDPGTPRVDGLDVVIGTDIEDERGPTSTLRDDEVTFDFLGNDPDTLQPRLLITREIGSPEFDAAFRRLDDGLRPVSAGRFGQDIRQTPFTVVPRNAALLLTFSQDLGVGDGFFVSRDATGRIDGVKNSTAVQLLEIVGDPRDADHTGDFRVVPVRVLPRGDRLVLDPVLLGNEGLQYQTRNSASGMPESPDQIGSNMRLAIALDGPLAIPGVHADDGSPWIGTNLEAARSVIRDFRSGNRADQSPDIARGFLRDADPPRLVGEMPFVLERVERLDDRTQLVTLYKNGIVHEIDRADVVRFVDPDSGAVVGQSEIVVDPEDDRGDPAAQHVRCVIRTVPGLGRIDPRGRPGYTGTLQQREAWLRAHGPRAVLVCEFTASREHPSGGDPYGDDPANFLVFSPAPLPLDDGTPSPRTENVSPFASAIVRFNKPIDLATVRAFDSLFLATRNVLDLEVIAAEFLTPRNLDPESFDREKFATPHLVASRVVDDNGSQTAVRLQTVAGLYLDQALRDADDGVPFEQKRFRYWLHLLGGADGIKDLSGNRLDFQAHTGARDFLVIPFSLDTRRRANGTPLFGDNLAVSIVRRFESSDEDEQPSLYRAGEAIELGVPPGPETFRLADAFGAFGYTEDGRFVPRPTARVTKVVDDFNQTPPPPASSDLRYCPPGHDAFPSAAWKFGAGIQNPLNPYGARLQTAWREIDMSLSRTDPFDFNLDVEQLYWAPFTDSPVSYDVFDRTSLFLGHSEYRPEPCVQFVPSMQNSGLSTLFNANYAFDRSLTGEREHEAPPHPAYVDRQLVVDPALAITEPNGINRFLPLPAFQQPYFVWRDERSPLQGGISGESSDVPSGARTFRAYIISPWLTGGGRFVTAGTGGEHVVQRGFWGNFKEFNLRVTAAGDQFTGGGLATIALPLLGDFWTWCDDPDLPVGNGFIATGYNGWQIAISVQTNPMPAFRAYSGGFAGAGSRPPICIGPSDREWSQAVGGYTPAGDLTQQPIDNSVYWIMADFLKVRTVATWGFVDVLNPHRMPPRTGDEGDPRLGPFFGDGSGGAVLPSRVLPRYEWIAEPPLDQLPAGTSIVPEFRAAGPVPAEPWRWRAEGMSESRRPNAINFPLDPLKACDAHMRKFDDRIRNGAPRNAWTYYYSDHMTDYTTEIQRLSDSNFTGRFAAIHERFDASDVRYFNWRFLIQNNANASPPVSPAIESFAVSYRFERR